MDNSVPSGAKLEHRQARFAQYGCRDGKKGYSPFLKNSLQWQVPPSSISFSW